MKLIYHISILIIVSILTIFNLVNRFSPGPDGSHGYYDKGERGLTGLWKYCNRGEKGFDESKVIMTE